MVVQLGVYNINWKCKDKGARNMNVETANRLMQYRKKAGLSQEELADKLGVSRQAVSKWECAESSPDTDNLIALSKIYGVSLDELINNEPQDKKETKEGFNFTAKDKDGSEVKVNLAGLNIHVKDDDGSEVHVGKDGVEIIDGDDRIKVDKYFEKKHNRKLRVAESLISSLTTLGVIVAYLLLGFLVKDGWRNYWVLFFLIPLAPTIMPAIYYRRFTIFAYPVLVVGVYLTLGMFLNYWHPWWILFFTIPVYYIIFKPIDKLNSRKIKVDDKVIDAHDYYEDHDDDDD